MTLRPRRRGFDLLALENSKLAGWEVLRVLSYQPVSLGLTGNNVNSNPAVYNILLHFEFEGHGRAPMCWSHQYAHNA